MPSHIFTRVGSWDESIATNTRSATVARSAADWPEAYHASDYAVYGYLQLARDGEARRVMDEAYKYSGGESPSPAFPYAAAAMPARFALERGDWKAAGQLQPTASKMPFTTAITYYARALGNARAGDIAAAEKDAEQLAVLHKQLETAKNTYWATEVEVQQLAAAGWIAHAKGKAEEGAKLMRAAADLEDRNEKHIVTPGRVLPARELLGEMLLEQKQPAEALKAFEASQVREPNRFRNYAGSAKAAQMMGDKAKAREYYAKLAELAKKGDGDRPELVLARTSLSQR
jgi:tetratricopeptide (TPR) repeat protein